MSKNYYKLGSHNVQCSVCGAKRKREDVRMDWKGFLSCIDKGCWDPKHPNEYPRRIINDGYPVQNAQPRPEVANASFITVLGITTWESANWSDPQWRWDDDPSQNDTTNPTQFL